MTGWTRKPGRILRAGQAQQGAATLNTHGRGKLVANHFRPASAERITKDTR